jgi:hypothetical protein
MPTEYSPLRLRKSLHVLIDEAMDRALSELCEKWRRKGVKISKGSAARQCILEGLAMTDASRT